MFNILLFPVQDFFLKNIKNVGIPSNFMKLPGSLSLYANSGDITDDHINLYKSNIIFRRSIEVNIL